MSRIYRWSPLTGPVFAVLFFVGFAVSGNSPNTSDSDAKIATYLAKTSSYHQNLASLIIALVAILLLGMFIVVLRQHIASDARLAGPSSLSLAAGMAAAVLLLIAVTCFSVTPLAAHDGRPSALDPGIFRLMQDLGYALWLGGGGFAAITVLATAAAAFRGALPRWYAWVSLVLGILTFGVIAFFGIFAFLLWAVITGILLVTRTPNAVSSTPGAGSPVA